MFAWRERLPSPSGGPAVELAITDRRGGVGVAPFDQLNLGVHVGDDPTAVARNRELLAGGLDLPEGRVQYMRQVHGREVSVVQGSVPVEPPEADALVTSSPRLALAVLVADCTPVLLADPRAGVVGVAHAGRRGLQAGVVGRLVQAMRALGARELVGRVGPSICGRCYEVPHAMREAVAAVVPQSRSLTRTGTPSLDVAAGVMAQLAEHCHDLAQVPGCSAEHPDLFSFRRDGVTGRYAGLAWLAP